MRSSRRPEGRDRVAWQSGGAATSRRNSESDVEFRRPSCERAPTRRGFPAPLAGAGNIEARFYLTAGAAVSSAGSRAAVLESERARGGRPQALVGFAAVTGSHRSIRHISTLAAAGSTSDRTLRQRPTSVAAGHPSARPSQGSVVVRCGTRRRGRARRHREKGTVGSTRCVAGSGVTRWLAS